MCMCFAGSVCQDLVLCVCEWFRMMCGGGVWCEEMVEV